jgi:hypothetical protein
MLLSRDALLSQSGATDSELNDLERDNILVPVRSWRNLWLLPRYTADQVDVVRWFVSARRAKSRVLSREHELLSGC